MADACKPQEWQIIGVCEIFHILVAWAWDAWYNRAPNVWSMIIESLRNGHHHQGHELSCALVNQMNLDRRYEDYGCAMVALFGRSYIGFANII
jgi:hypothetical protein